MFPKYSPTPPPAAPGAAGLLILCEAGTTLPLAEADVAAFVAYNDADDKTFDAESDPVNMAKLAERDAE